MASQSKFIRLISISGPHGAGKEEVGKHLRRTFAFLTRVVPCTTRQMRPGEKSGREYWFISPTAFLDLQGRPGALVYQVAIRGHHSGTTRTELMRHDTAIIDITPEGARTIGDLLMSEQIGVPFKIFVHASERERRGRIRVREPGIAAERVDEMIKGDPVASDPALYSDFDLVIENPDDALDETCTKAEAAVRIFLGI